MIESATILRNHGIPVTAQRLALLRAVNVRPHSTADTLAEAVRAEIGAVSKQAVYNTLATFVEKGLLRRIQPAGSPALYETRVGDNHHHLICRSCGKTVDVACVVGERPCLSAADGQGFLINEAEVIFWGNCPGCLGAAEAAKPSACEP